MSELKWNWVYYPYLDASSKQEESALKAGYIKVVIKDKADAVIANRDYEIKKLKDSISKLMNAKTEQIIDEVMQKALIYGEGFVRIEDMMKLIAELRHQKFKRCLAMARWCEMSHRELLTRACLPTKQNWNRHDEWRYFVNFWHRYEYRFKKLAEKFKEAK